MRNISKNYNIEVIIRRKKINPLLIVKREDINKIKACDTINITFS